MSAASSSRAVLAVDLRSLAVLRALLAAFLFVDALLRLLDAGRLYGDAGVLPRALAVQLLEPARLSLHLANGSTTFALLLGLLQVWVAAALFLGWRARLAAPVLWVLLASAAMRNPLAVTAADTLALLLLGLGLFLRWNARWSIDALTTPEARDAADDTWPARVALLHAAALPLGVVLSSSTLAALLSTPEAHAPGRWLLSAPGLVTALDSTLRLAAALVLPLVLVSAAWRPARHLALGLAALLCVLTLGSVSLGGAGLLLLAATALLIDPTLWNRLAGADQDPELRVYFDQSRDPGGRLARGLREFLALPRTRVQAAQDSPRAARLAEGGARLIVIGRDEQAHLDADAAAVLLRRSPLLRMLWPVLGTRAATRWGARLLRGSERRARAPDRASSIGPSIAAGRGATTAALVLGLCLALAPLLSPARAVLRPLALDLPWSERLATPGAARTWILVAGDPVADGPEVDARQGDHQPLDYTVPPRPFFAGERGRAYERALLRDAAAPARVALARYLCAQHQPPLARLRMVALIHDEQSDTPEQRVLLRHTCLDAP